jgi:hypothetical protein
MSFALYLTLSLALFGSYNGAQVGRPSTGCPLIHAKDAGQCDGTISECWSPGQLDVDCEGSDGDGLGLCCFDGCVNVCSVPKVCETVYETRFENVTKEVCKPEKQEPICTVETFQVCMLD